MKTFKIHKFQSGLSKTKATGIFFLMLCFSTSSLASTTCNADPVKMQEQLSKIMTDKKSREQDSGNEDIETSAESQEESDDAAEKLAEFETLFGTSIPANLTKVPSILKLILDNKKVDADQVWKISRQMRDYVAAIPGADDDIIKFKNDVNELLGLMIKTSYSTELHYDANLSHNVKTRLPELLLSFAKIVKCDINNKTARNNFLDDLNLLASSYNYAKRFYLGIGIEQAYIPTITYTDRTQIDLSEFQTDVLGGSDRLTFTNRFSEQGYTAINILARVPYVSFKLSLPDYSDTDEVVLPVNQRSEFPNINGELFYRSTVTSRIDIDYDIAVSTSLLEPFQTDDPTSSSTDRHDIGLTLGVIGAQLSTDFSHDVRIRQTGGIPFNEIDSLKTLTDSASRDITTYYVGLYGEYLISDEFAVGINAKHFLDDDENDGLTVDGTTVSLMFNWYPSTSDSILFKLFD